MKLTPILFLASNPKNTDNLRLGEESRSIDEAIREPNQCCFELKQAHAVRVSDLQKLLFRYNPVIVHFSGHGSNSNEILVEDTSGNSHPISPIALSRLFSLHKDTVKFVVLNACYSEKQARAIAENVDFVIGMNTAIGDEAAINFARAFYLALAYGRTIKFSFDSGCSEIEVHNLNEEDIPRLLTRKGCNPKETAFIGDSVEQTEEHFNETNQEEDFEDFTPIEEQEIHENTYDYLSSTPLQSKPDLLSGRWNLPTGGHWEIIKQDQYYRAMEFNVFLQKIAEGRAVIKGNNVIISMNGFNGVHYDANLFLNDNMLQGTVNSFGFIQSILVYRANVI